MQRLPLGIQPYGQVDDRDQLGQFGRLIGPLVQRPLGAEADLVHEQNGDQQQDREAHGGDDQLAPTMVVKEGEGGCDRQPKPSHIS